MQSTALDDLNTYVLPAAEMVKYFRASSVNMVHK